MARPIKRVRWALEYAALAAVFTLVRILPERWWRSMGRGLGGWIHDRTGFRRAVVRENMAHAFPERDEANRSALARAFYVRLGETMLEFFALGGWNGRDILRRVDHEGLEHLESLRSEGRGAILTTGHFGNWELLGSSVAALGFPIRVVARTQSNPWVDAMQNRVRERAGMRVIKADTSVRQVIRSVRGGEFVAMLPDVNAGDDGVFVEFLGRQASTPRGVAYFAWKLGCPLVPSVIVARGDGTHAARFLEPIEPDTSLDEETAVRTLTQALADRLAEQIRLHPDHYFWVHRRWKTRPPATGGTAEEEER